MSRYSRSAFTLVELLTVTSIIAVLLALILPAIQRIRAAAERGKCSNQMRQIGLALVHFHDETGALPMGVTPVASRFDYPSMTWMARILPYIEQDALWQQAVGEYQLQRSPFFPRGHRTLAAPVATFSCPSDPRGGGPHPTLRRRTVGVSSYVGVLGTDHLSKSGVLYRESRTRFEHITDGTSNTIMVGERPPSADFWYGWWYAGVGMKASGSPDSLLGVREVRTGGAMTGGCPKGPYHFQSVKHDDRCATYQFWSYHPGGGHFLFCDGSVQFLTYATDSVLPSLATRAGGEVVDLPN